MSEQHDASPGRIDWFPSLHTRPAQGWVNDPNGIGVWDGRWHVMFQWNPDSPRHADVHWGHMSSPDLLTWRDEGVALRPRPGDIDAVGVWSGVAVHDAGDVALVYTAVPDHARNARVAIARRRADGTWGQPSESATMHPDHEQWCEGRDPFVVMVDGRRLGIIGAGQVIVDAGATAGHRRSRGAVLVYDATDLDHWTFLGPLLVADQLPSDMTGAGAIWECPQLLPLEDRWLLVVSFDEGDRPDLAGSDEPLSPRQGVTAFVGDLDLSGPVPRFIATSETPLDEGPDYYAPQLVADGSRLLAWAWAWEGRGSGTNHRPDDDVVRSGWAGTLTFPREVMLGVDGGVCSIPARELEGLTGDTLRVEHTADGWLVRTSVASFTFTTTGAVDIDVIDRSTGATRPVWSGASPDPIRVFIDGSIVEIFTSTGTTTVRAYPNDGEAWRVRANSPIHAATLRLP